MDRTGPPGGNPFVTNPSSLGPCHIHLRSYCSEPLPESRIVSISLPSKSDFFPNQPKQLCMYTKMECKAIIPAGRAWAGSILCPVCLSLPDDNDRRQ
jgi:hypothetical protein